MLNIKEEEEITINILPKDEPLITHIDDNVLDKSLHYLFDKQDKSIIVHDMIVSVSTHLEIKRCSITAFVISGVLQETKETLTNKKNHEAYDKYNNRLISIEKCIESLNATNAVLIMVSGEDCKYNGSFICEQKDFLTAMALIEKDNIEKNHKIH